jgi:hypothetical protein
MNNVKIGTDAKYLYMQFKHGGSYQTSGYVRVNNKTAFADGSAAVSSSASASQIEMLRDSAGTGTGESMNFEFILHDPLATDNSKFVTWEGTQRGSDGLYGQYFGGGTSAVETAIDAVKLYMQSSATLTGDFTLYGITT